MNRFIAIDPGRCIACGTCLAACSDAHKQAGRQAEPRLALYQSRDVVASLTCHHCEGAPCLKVCPVNAISHDEDGCVRVDERRCIGCKLCAIACPFGAVHMSGTSIAGVAGISFNTPTFPASLNPILQWQIGVASCAVKCDLCSFDPEGGPRCVNACLTHALRLVESDDKQGESAEKRVKALQSSLAIFAEADADVTAAAIPADSTSGEEAQQ